MFGDAASPDLVDKLFEVARLRGPLRHGRGGFQDAVCTAVLDSLTGGSACPTSGPTRLDHSHDAFLDHLGGQAVERALKRVARVDFLAVNPSLAILPVDVVAE